MMTALILALPALFQSGPTAQDLNWLAGCWETTRSSRHIVEQWMPPEGGTLMGMSRTVAGGKTTEYEFLLIREGARGLEFVAKPSGQAEATFTSVRISADEAVFENPTHDFPTRIIYQRKSEKEVMAAIEGTMNGQARRIEFPFTACGR